MSTLIIEQSLNGLQFSVVLFLIASGLTLDLTKDQILRRMPLNLKTLELLIQRNRRDFARLTNRRASPEQRKAARKRFICGRRKALSLVEELRSDGSIRPDVLTAARRALFLEVFMSVSLARERAEPSSRARP